MTTQNRRKIKVSGTPKQLKKRLECRYLNIDARDSSGVADVIQQGLGVEQLEQLQQAMALPWDRMAQLVAIPRTTLNRKRRQHHGRLTTDESDRVVRAARLFAMTVDLFEGNTQHATEWLLAAQPALGGRIPLEFASTGVGAREVENLILRLEHGVFT